MDRKNHLTDQAASHIVEDDSVKVQEPYENISNKFKWNKLKAAYGGFEASDALASDQEGDNSTKVEDNELHVNIL